METLMEWLPRVGAVLTMLIGLAGFFKPTVITDGCGLGSIALYANDSSVFLALGTAWGLATLARLYSMVADGSTVQDSIPPILVDGTIALLALSSQL